MSDLNPGTDIPANIPIKNVSVNAYTIPTHKPESDGTLEWDSTTLVLVSIDAGDRTGIGYSYADVSTAYLIEKSLKAMIINRNAMNIPGITDHLIHQIRNNGQTGIAMMGVSAIDNALWDLKAKLLHLPLCTLLGQAKEQMLLYGSGGFTSYSDEELEDEFSNWVSEGILHVKMKIGREPSRDTDRVKTARSAIGKDTGLFVDANGAYTVKQALLMAGEFANYDVTWFEEPVPSSDLAGLHLIRSRAPFSFNIAAGEYGYNLPYFKAMLGAGAVDILQADATRCGGISNFLKVGQLCEAYQLPFSSHCAPSLHLHAALSLPSFYIAEYFRDHVRIEQMLFEGIAQPKQGTLSPDLGRPGIGFEFKYKDAEQYKVL